MLKGRDWVDSTAFELGEWIERGTRPGDVYLHFFQPEMGPKRYTRNWGPVSYYRLDPVKPGEVAPPQGWLSQIGAMLRELGKSGVAFALLDRRLPESHRDRHRAVVTMAKAIRDRLGESHHAVADAPTAQTNHSSLYQASIPTIEGAPGLEEATLGVPMHRATGWMAPGYLGIEVHESDWKLRRPDRVEVNFGGQRLMWNLALRFIDAGDKYVSAEDQVKIWRDHGRESFPGAETITTQFCRLNALIKPLGIQIVAAAGRGRRLQEIVGHAGPRIPQGEDSRTEGGRPAPDMAPKAGDVSPQDF